MAEEGLREVPFAGVDAPNTTPMPDVYFDVLMPRLGKASLKVLLYLIRRIFGFKKEGDTVSLSQICSGIRKRDGTILDRGTGLSRHAATKAIRDLEELGVIAATRGVSDKGDPAPTYYRLRFRETLSVHDLLRPNAMRAVGYRFPGIDSPNTTPVPDVYFDLLLPDLGLAEWRVLLYVVRRTLGFKKLSDAISLDQFTDGIVTHDGARLDAGTGLSRSNVHEALNQLVMRNVLVRRRI
ncbi:MAG: replication protein, partial [Chloroflexota bacterium]